MFRAILLVTVATLITCCVSMPTESPTPCKENEVCKLIDDCSEVRLKMLINKSDRDVTYCDMAMEKVCCPFEDISKWRISFRKCQEYSKTTCPDTPIIADTKIAEVHGYPFMALIEGKNGTVTEQLCGGTLLSKDYVLTAAHCFLNGRDKYPYEIFVRLGVHNQANSKENTKRIGVSLNCHDDYKNDARADLCLLKLEQPVEFTETFRPACLPRQSSNINNKYNVCGWGMFNAVNQLSDELRIGTFIEVDPENCRDTHKKSFDPTKQICGEPEGNKDVCEGDSGGPLFTAYKGYDSCLVEVFGIVSTGGQCTIAHSYTRYTRIFPYLDWIEKVVWNV